MPAAQTYPGNELELCAAADHWRHYWSSLIQTFIGERVLEVGAGIGSVTRLLAAEHADWTALEPDPDLARQVSAWARQGAYGGVTSITGVLASLPADQHFDTILYIDVLEHIDNDRKEVEDAYARLSPGGNLIILVPAHNSLYTPFDKAIGHFRRYNRRQIEALKPSEAIQVKNVYLDCLGMAASMMNKFILRASMPSSSQIRFWDQIVVPLSRQLDPLLGHNIGKTLLTVWSRPGQPS